MGLAVTSIEDYLAGSWSEIPLRRLTQDAHGSVDVLVERGLRLLFSERSPASVAVLDIPAPSPGNAFRILTSPRLHELAEQLDVAVTTLLVVDDSRTASGFAAKTVNALRAKTDYVIVRVSRGSAPTQWDVSADRDIARSLYGAKEVAIGPVTPDVWHFLDDVAIQQNLPPSLVAASAQTQDGFVAVRAHWLRTTVIRQLTEARAALLPPALQD